MLELVANRFPAVLGTLSCIGAGPSFPLRFLVFVFSMSSSGSEAVLPAGEKVWRP